jgi:adenylylsulfate kinase
MSNALYIGRFQPPHQGHFACIRWILQKHEQCLVLVRDTSKDEKNPFSLRSRIKILREEFKNEAVIVKSIPDIDTAYIGRDVGYGLIQLEPELERIRATDIRTKMYERGKGFVVWFTGLPSAGKTTIAAALVKKLQAHGLRIEHLDGDTFRKNISADLKFSDEDRRENIRRAGFVAEALCKQGIGVIASFISPHRDVRDALKQQIPRFFEVYVNTPLEVCMQRDVKGLYRAKTSNMTGIDSIYEPPIAADITINHPLTVDDAIKEILLKI